MKILFIESMLVHLFVCVCALHEVVHKYDQSDCRSESIVNFRGRTYQFLMSRNINRKCILI
jgi:hypothetical protein